MNHILRYIFFHVFIQFIVKVILGVNVRNLERIPTEGPLVVVANHNSHLDTMVIMSLLINKLPIVKPVAAMDYFLKNRFIAWFSLKIIGILPLKRKPQPGEDVLQPVYQSLMDGKILILFPEGSRGQPEEFQKLKSGIARVSEKLPEVPIVPIYFYGLGKALPKGESLIVPFFCDAYVGEPLYWDTSKPKFMENLQASFNRLKSESECEI